jgi:TonB family protein
VRMLFFLLLVGSCFGQTEPRRIITVEKYVAPTYPPIARAARVAGEVTIRLRVAASGEVLSAEIVSGHPMLRESALENIKQWRFHCFPCWDDFTHEITYRYTQDRNYLEPLEVRYEFPGLVHLDVGGALNVITDEPIVCWQSPNWRAWIRPWLWPRIRFNTHHLPRCVALDR